MNRETIIVLYSDLQTGSYLSNHTQSCLQTFKDIVNCAWSTLAM